MDLNKMIAELQMERDRLDQAILALERLSAGQARRRGRPPRWLKEQVEKSEQEGSQKGKKPASGGND
ncbi:MAG: hypothetical protein JO270_16300 [Acidobacteriaceae bacterium]|nr:hypothetical protein [Acidobacteriaceae bacterium]MBV8569281.1 hypothetical protein [Acidobacteriaceae bacterium]